MDEIKLKIRGKSRWLMTVIDGYARFWPSCDMAVQDDAILLFQEARNPAGMVPGMRITNGLSGYHNSIFAAKNPLGRMTIHIRDIHIRNQFRSSNVEERFNGTPRAGIIPCRRAEKGQSSCHTVVPCILQPHEAPRQPRNEARRGRRNQDWGTQQVDSNDRECGVLCMNA